MTKAPYLRILDTRKHQPEVVSLTWPEHETLSKTLRPSIHSNGYIIACGQQSKPVISIFDIRFVRGEKRRHEINISMQVKDKKILRSEFHPERDELVVMGGDYALQYLDFRLTEQTPAAR